MAVLLVVALRELCEAAGRFLVGASVTEVPGHLKPFDRLGRQARSAFLAVRFGDTEVSGHFQRFDRLGRQARSVAKTLGAMPAIATTRANANKMGLFMGISTRRLVDRAVST